MRLFTAIDLPDDVRNAIQTLQRKLKPTAKISWSPAANLHITTKFIGEWPAERLNDLEAALNSVAKSGRIPISIRQTGWFPNAAAPRVFWIGIEAPQALRDLAKATDEAAASLGIVRETKPYTPHLTLARIRVPAELGPLKQALASLPTTEFGSFTAESYHLYLSEMGSGSSVYTKLSSYTLIP